VFDDGSDIYIEQDVYHDNDDDDVEYDSHILGYPSVYENTCPYTGVPSNKGVMHAVDCTHTGTAKSQEVEQNKQVQ
jgi:hypothetical protein